MPADFYRDGHLTMDFARHEVEVDGQPVHLPPRRYCILEVLARHPRVVFSRRTLLEAGWGPGTGRDEHNVTYQIMRLRQQGVAGIEAVREFGYRYVPPEAR